MEGAPFLLPSDLQQFLPQLLSILMEGGREERKEEVVMGREGGIEERKEEEIKDLIVTLGAVLSFVLHAAQAMRDGEGEGVANGWCIQEQEEKENEQQRQQQQQLYKTLLLLQKCLLALPPFLSHILNMSHGTQRWIQRLIFNFAMVDEEEGDDDEDEEKGGREEREGWNMVRLTAEILMVVEEEKERDREEEHECESRKEAISASSFPSSSTFSSSSSFSFCAQVSDWWAALLGAGAVTPLIVEEAWLELLRSPALCPLFFPPCPVEKKEYGVGEELQQQQQQQEWRAAARRLVENYDRSAMKNHFMCFGRLRAAAFL